MNNVRTFNHRSKENRSQISFEQLEARQLYSAGGLDPSFGVGGSETNPLGFTTTSIAVQSDNKTVVIGQTHNNFAVGRLNANGTVDTSFGTNGKIETSFGAGTVSTAEQVLVQSDGRIVVIGLNTPTSNMTGQWLVARYNTNGSLDTTFGNGGKESVLGNSNNYRDVRAIAQQSTGKIVFAADFYGSGQDGCAVVRLQTNGMLDTTFGDMSPTGGYKGYSVVGNDKPGFNVGSMLIQPDGKILLGGDRFASTPAGDEYEASLFRLTSTGIADSTFGSGGLVQTYQVEWSDITALTFDQQTNQIIAAGSIDPVISEHRPDLVTVLRYNAANGAFDANFGDGGVETEAPGGAVNFWATAVTMPTPYTILVVGTSSTSSYQTLPVEMQFTSTGKLDTTFHAPASTPVLAGFQTAITNDGRIVIANGIKFERIDEAAPTVSVVKLTDGTEGGSNGSVRFILDQVYNFDVNVEFTVGGTATPFADYTGPLVVSAAKNRAAGLPANLGRTTVFAGTGQITLPVNVVKDPINENTETVIVSLVADADQTYFVGGPFTATVNIFNT